MEVERYCIFTWACVLSDTEAATGNACGTWVQHAGAAGQHQAFTWRLCSPGGAWEIKGQAAWGGPCKASTAGRRYRRCEASSISALIKGVEQEKMLTSRSLGCKITPPPSLPRHLRKVLLRPGLTPRRLNDMAAVTTMYYPSHPTLTEEQNELARLFCAWNCPIGSLVQGASIDSLQA